MGNSISPILSDIVMEDFETECIKKLSIKPTFYFRYVDDIILFIQSNSTNHILNTFKIFENKVVNNSSLSIHYNNMLKNNDHQ